MGALTDDQIWKLFVQQVNAGLIGIGVGGTPGPAGPTGPQGPAGPTGATGASGAQALDQPHTWSAQQTFGSVVASSVQASTFYRQGVLQDSDPSGMYNAANSGTSKIINWTDHRKQRLTMTGNCVLSLSNPTDGGRYYLQIHTGVGGFVLAWPEIVKWPGGNAPTLTTTTGRVDIVVLVYSLAAGVYYANVSQNYGSPIIPPPGPIDPPTPGTLFPMSAADPVFTGMTEVTAAGFYASPVTLANRSYNVVGGDPAIIAESSITLDHCRITGREGLRVVKNTINLSWCFLNIGGIGDDHADAIQAYSPGDSATWTISHSTFKQGDGVGIFVADDHTSVLTLSNVLFWGGTFGIRVNDDGNPCSVSFTDVYFVRDSFDFAPYLLDCAVTHWERVYWCDIVGNTPVNLVLIPTP